MIWNYCAEREEKADRTEEYELKKNLKLLHGTKISNDDSLKYALCKHEALL